METKNQDQLRNPDQKMCTDDSLGVNSKEKMAASFADLVKQLEYCPEDLPEQQLWDLILAYANEPFYTFKGLEFRYSVKGNEMFIDRKEKSITRSTVRIAARQALEIRHRGDVVSGPKKLGTFGASYLYPIFKVFGLVQLS